MKPNPKNFEAFIDPDGGEWIKIKQGKFKNVVWRPVDMKVEDTTDNSGDGVLNFTTEFLGEVPKDFDQFEKVSGAIITDILREYVDNEDSNNNSSKT